MSDFVPMASIGIGAYLLWFGVHYWRDQGTTYPHTVIKSVVSGGALPAPDTEASRAAAAKAQLGADVTAAVTDSSGGTPAGSTPAPAGSSPAPAAGAGSEAADKAYILQLWGGDATQAGAMESIIALEDASYDPTISNEAGSGAFGIAQALGHGTAADQGTDSDEYGGYGLTTAEAVAANSGDADDQLLWEYNYIKETYGTATAALAFHEANGYY